MGHHDTIVAAPRQLDASRRPLILDRDDEDFVAAVLGEFSSEAGRAKLDASRAVARNAGGVLKLFQPIQRRFHVALVEAWCDTPGRPRLDPRKVDSAGLVLRRLRRQDDGTQRLEGWMHAGGVVRGWLPVDRLGDPQANPDPQPAIRLAGRDTGVASLDRALRALNASADAATLEEQVAPMFVAPPQVCAQSGRTLYYGVVPTSSSERAQAPQDTATLFKDFGPESAEFTSHLVQPLRGLSFTFPDPGNDRFFDAGWFEELQQAPTPSDAQRFLQLLRQLVVEFDAFGDSSASRALLAELEGITLPYLLQPGETGARSTSAASFLRAASRVLLEGEGGSVEMPQQWPALGDAARRRLARAMSDSMLERFRSVTGRPGRYDEPDAQYVLRAFVRLKPHDGCPARTVWCADYSEPFVIAPWYEGGGSTVQIQLPDLSDRAVLKSMKPNVSFLLPPKLQNILGSSLKDMIDGKKSDAGFTVGWICSFSIPVITFCAFLVLNIFLSLFDLFFRWLLLIKICIPYPKAK